MMKSSGIMNYQVIWKKFYYILDSVTEFLALNHIRLIGAVHVTFFTRWLDLEVKLICVYRKKSCYFWSSTRIYLYILARLSR